MNTFGVSALIIVVKEVAEADLKPNLLDKETNKIDKWIQHSFKLGVPFSMQFQFAN